MQTSIEPTVLAHTRRVARHVREVIARSGGRISFARYMDLVLYAPELGYYRTQGAGLDYVTAPEVSTLFSRCVACQIAEVLEALGGGDVMEIGAGSGTMAADVMNELDARGKLPGHYLIVEQSPVLRRRQRATIRGRAARLAERFDWCEALPGGPFRGVAVANELLDAFPAVRFGVSDQGLGEWCVVARDEQFAWSLKSVGEGPLLAAVRDIEQSLDAPLAPGFVSELSLAQPRWIADAARMLEAGVLLLFDYGYARREYYHPQRSRGTLSCFFRHCVHDDPLVLPGAQDISVHVDFTCVARAGLSAGLDLGGFTTQGEFLLALGILDALAGGSPGSRDYVDLTRQIKQLTLPGQMGETVKVLALSRGVPGPLSGFTGRDLRAGL